MLNIINHAPWLWNSVPPNYHEQYAAAMKRMYSNGSQIETDNREVKKWTTLHRKPRSQ